MNPRLQLPLRLSFALLGLSSCTFLSASRPVIWPMEDRPAVVSPMTVNSEKVGLTPPQERISLLGAPAFLPPAAQSGPLRAELEAPTRGRSGQNLDLRVKLHNVSMETLNLEWGADAVDAVLMDSRGKPVRWGTPPPLFYIGQNGKCLPLQPCAAKLRLTLPLSSGHPRLPLAPGQYRLTVRLHLQEIKTGTSRAVFDLTFPERSLTVLP